MRIVQLANLVTPTSGGIRTVLTRLGRGYTQRGHHVTLVRPALHPSVELGADGIQRIELHGVELPRSGGYRLLLDRAAVADVLLATAPDVIEVHDRFTLTWIAAWARTRGIGVVTVVHERLTTSLRSYGHLGPLAAPVERGANRRLVRRAAPVVVASGYAAAGFGSGAPQVRVVPLGVDHDRFHPARAQPRRPGSAPLRLVVVSRLSGDKRPELAIDTVHHLVGAGVDCHLDVVGDGPGRPALERRARGAPVTFHGHVGVDAVAVALASADVALAPCPTEAFGLAALEALACGTPVVAPTTGGVGELLGHPPGSATITAAGATSTVDAAAFAAATRALHAMDVTQRRCAAVTRANGYSWDRTVTALLGMHGVPARPAIGAP